MIIIILIYFIKKIYLSKIYMICINNKNLRLSKLEKENKIANKIQKINLILNQKNVYNILSNKS